MGIIRNRYHGNFTVIPNSIREDRRLSPEGLGVLTYLLGLHPDWEVHVNQVADRFNCGRRMYRIIQELIEAGYIIRNQRRAEDGSGFGAVSYDVYDHPQSGSLEDRFYGTVHVENVQAQNVDAQNGHLLKTERDKELKGNNLCPTGSDIEVPEAVKPKRTPQAYTQEFEEFWQAYPDRTNNSKIGAFKEWNKLSTEDRSLAMKGLPAFSAYCRKNKDYRAVHCERYLSQRRFDSWAAAPSPAAQAYFRV